MKKIFTLILMTAMMPWCASAQTGTQLPLGGGWNNGFVGEADVYSYTVEKLYGAADFACNVLSADYPKCILEFEEPLAANFQINYSWKASADAEGGDTQTRYGVAVGDGAKKTFEIPFDTEHPYITSVSVQHTDENAANLSIKKLILVSATDEQKKVAPAFTGWAGTDNTVLYRGTVSFNAQYQQIVIKNVAGKSNLTLKVELGEGTENVQMCVDYEDNTSEWPKFEGKTITFTTKTDAIIKNVGIQYAATEPASIYVDGAWDISGSDAIEKVEIVNTVNAELYSVAGQKVGKNYKGLVIDRATGKKFINR